MIINSKVKSDDKGSKFQCDNEQPEDCSNSDSEKEFQVSPANPNDTHPTARKHDLKWRPGHFHRINNGYVFG